MYNLTLKTPPVIEPISLVEAKSYLRLDGVDADEDSYLSSVIIAAREWCEGYQRRAYITQTWEMSLDYWPEENIIEIPKGSLQTINLVKYKNSLGVEIALTENVDFIYSARGILGRLSPCFVKYWPTFTPYPLDAIVIEFTCGYGNTVDKIPRKVIHAMKLLVSHWYENRVPLNNMRSIPTELDFTVSALLGMERIYYA